MAKNLFSAALIVSLSFLASAQNHSTKTVTMKSISFDPKVLQVKIGDSVEWENKSHTEHSATADENSAFDTGLVAPNNKSKKINFDKPGTYKYHCSIHGKSMSGEITVAP
jgi:plastocyanin